MDRAPNWERSRDPELQQQLFLQNLFDEVIISKQVDDHDVIRIKIWDIKEFDRIHSLEHDNGSTDLLSSTMDGLDEPRRGACINIIIMNDDAIGLP